MKRKPAAAVEIVIEIANHQDCLRLDLRRLRTAVRRALRAARVAKARISVAVVDDATIARLNWRYLRHPGPTDVLSFLLDSRAGLEGEVIVSAEAALRSAPHFGLPPRDELILYAVHGTLHLAGYDDRTPQQSEEMRKRETEVLKSMEISPR